MKRFFAFIYLFFISLSLFAINQKGVVKTIARPNKTSTQLAGAVVRIRGSHNAVESQSDGSFTFLLANKQNGDPIAISSVFLSEYELAEQELIGRQMACSELVPIEIFMVNRNDLQREKDAIARKARENVELYYEKRVAALNNDLKSGKILQQEYERRIEDLETKYEKFEPLIEMMSDKYARTDINKIDSMSILINTAIEEGNLDEAERLINSKGNINEREEELIKLDLQNKESQRIIEEATRKLETSLIIAKQKKQELADDCYRLYSIHLSRFQNDSAAIFIKKRADLDTLNVDYQLQAGQFLKEIMADYNQASIYLHRACEQANANYESVSGPVATALHELASLARFEGNTTKAISLYEQSLLIRKQLHGDKSISVAQTLNDLGEIYSQNNELDKALTTHTDALTIRQSLLQPDNKEIAESYNNIGGVYFKQRKVKESVEAYQKAISIYENNNSARKELAMVYNNLASSYYIMGRYSDSINYFQKSYNSLKQILGEQHPLTQQALKNLNLVNEKINKHK